MKQYKEDTNQKFDMIIEADDVDESEKPNKIEVK